ncbi:cobaltochelatase subunit CobN [Methanobrevibacter sp. DSM 116169]|uniref:cobaltochelatase subunit CobN n=1 Tax=Methanobrevibacter sp. DSM 116169 TaxID=3242727 RepID=UPI0038FC6CDD
MANDNENIVNHDLIINDNALSNEDLSLASSDTIFASDTSSITVNVKDSYNESLNTWVEDGFSISNAKVEIFDSQNNLVFSDLTDKKGQIISNNLNNGNYRVDISYLTYEIKSFNVNLNSNKVLTHTFYPDIILVMTIGHQEKIDALMGLSRRVAYIHTDVYEKEKDWLLEFANYVHLDMYIDSKTDSIDLGPIKNSPANDNYKIAYTFGVYGDTIIKSLGLNFIGGSVFNNTPNTLENTYIGSYFQAQDTPDISVMEENMKNYLDYMFYLINPNKYKNPTLDSSRTPLFVASFGLYHPDIGTILAQPEPELINKWIISNPGYDADGNGSLNWMVEEYSLWAQEFSSPEYLTELFEKEYFKKFSFNTPYIAIASYYAGGPLVDALIRAYESENRAAINVFQSVPDPKLSLAKILAGVNNASKYGFSAVNSLVSWSLDYSNLGNGGATDTLSELDLSILNAVNQISETSYNNELGPQMEWIYAVTIPSFESIFGSIVVSYVDSNGVEQIIQSGVDKLVKMTLGWANLKEKDNDDKIVSIVLYNYPPGKNEIGASFLDVFESIHDILEVLYDEGYDIGMSKEEIPNANEIYTIVAEFGNKGTWAQGLLNEYVEKYFDTLMNNGQLINSEKYQELVIDSLDYRLYQQMYDYWNGSENELGKIMVYNGEYIVIPGIFFGNIFITFQPSRGWEEVSNYHDLEMPPHQQYVTFYKWLDEVLNTDAIINLGTHGTLEFLPGRSIGLQEDDWSFALTLNPTIYPYIVSNPGEGMVAKDRLGSLIITHMTPAIVESELYGDYVKLKDAILQYENAVKNNVTQQIENAQKAVIEFAISLGFDSNYESFDNWAEELHDYLELMENDLNVLGMHSLGYVLSGEELIQEVITIVSSKTEIYNRLTAFLFPELADLDFYKNIITNRKYEGEVVEIKAWLYKFIEELVYNTASCNDLAKKYGIENDSELYDDLLECVDVIIGIQSNMEWKSLISALSGGYVFAGLFADPSYGNSLPTGTNGYVEDSSKMPTKIAYESAKEMMDLKIAAYYEEEGKCPELFGLVLWGTEILRTNGMGIGEFLYLLGVEPIWSRSGTVTGVKLIPLEDLTITLSNGTVLNRPRIDVYASIVTSNSYWIKLMVNAVNIVFYNTPDEDSSVNFVKKHYAENPSLDRLFGLPGNILEGTGGSDFLSNPNNWQDLDDLTAVLADIYLTRVSYSWSIDEKGNIIITQKRDDYSYLLGKVDVISQNMDSTWRLLDTDDYVDWFYTMWAVAKELGADPYTMIGDSRNLNNFKMRDVIAELQLEIRTNVLNPKFIEAMLSSPGGTLKYYSMFEEWWKYEILHQETTGESTINTNLYDQMANVLLEQSSNIRSDSQAYGLQSSIAIMIHAIERGYYNADPQMLENLVNKFIEIVNEYGIACCHHTCGNLNLMNKIVVSSTLSDKIKQDFSDIIQAVTLKDPIYNSTTTNPETQNTDSNGTSTDEPSPNTDSEGSVGEYGNDKSPSISSSTSGSDSQKSSKDNSESSDSSESGDAYEISKTSSKSSASVESSMPIYFIAAIIVLIIVFAIGYLRNKDNEF